MLFRSIIRSISPLSDLSSLSSLSSDGDESVSGEEDVSEFELGRTSQSSLRWFEGNSSKRTLTLRKLLEKHLPNFVGSARDRNAIRKRKAKHQEKSGNRKRARKEKALTNQPDNRRVNADLQAHLCEWPKKTESEDIFDQQVCVHPRV